MAHKNLEKIVEASAAKVITLYQIVRAQARNRPVGITRKNNSLQFSDNWPIRARVISPTNTSHIIVTTY